MESYVKLSTEKYEELAKKCLMLERAYKELKSYEINAILKTIFGEKEEAC